MQVRGGDAVRWHPLRKLGRLASRSNQERPSGLRRLHVPAVRGVRGGLGAAHPGPVRVQGQRHDVRGFRMLDVSCLARRPRAPSMLRSAHLHPARRQDASAPTHATGKPRPAPPPLPPLQPHMHTHTATTYARKAKAPKTLMRPAFRVAEGARVSRVCEEGRARAAPVHTAREPLLVYFERRDHARAHAGNVPCRAVQDHTRGRRQPWLGDVGARSAKC